MAAQTIVAVHPTDPLLFLRAVVGYLEDAALVKVQSTVLAF